MAAKYYVDLNGIYEGIVDNWNECEKIRITQKMKVNFKSFKTLEEAKATLAGIKGGNINVYKNAEPKKKSDSSNHGIIEFWEYEKKDGDYLIFTDGGCDKNQAGNPISDYGYSAIVTRVSNDHLEVVDILGGIITLNGNKAPNKENMSDYLAGYEDISRQANITGELHAARLAYSYCVAKKITNFYIVCDYMGVGYFCTGYYKNNLQPQSANFKKYFDMITGPEGPVSAINFIHTPSHLISMNPDAAKYKKMVKNADDSGRKQFIYKNAELLAGNYNADELAGLLKSGKFELADNITESVSEVITFYDEKKMEAVDYKKYLLTNAYVYAQLEDIPHGNSGFWNDYEK